jgi:hypothetical protein
MSRASHACAVLLLVTALALPPPRAAAASATAVDPNGEQAEVSEWRARRIEALKSDEGWLTLAGLFWLKEGENRFGTPRRPCIAAPFSSAGIPCASPPQREAQ